VVRLVAQRHPGSEIDIVKRVMAVGLVVLAGCGASSSVGPASDGGADTYVKLPDTQPYFGRLKSVDDPAADAGEFMLARCGCMCWRVMIIREDGAVRTQMLVHFRQTPSDAEAGDEYTVVGGAEGATLTGSVWFDEGQTSGRMVLGPYAMVFEAQRSDEEADLVVTCTKGHFGEDPIRRLPADHPPYEESPPNCLKCHSLQ